MTRPTAAVAAVADQQICRRGGAMSMGIAGPSSMAAAAAPIIAGTAAAGKHPRASSPHLGEAAMEQDRSLPR
jgi:hypothetical protein